MIDRRAFIGALASGLLAAPLVANTQPRERVARLGFLAASPREAMQSVVSTMAERLGELGYVEGQNLVIEFRHAETEQKFQELTTQLVASGSQVIFAQGPYALRGARAASAIIQIVALDLESDPVAAGYAASLARPGGNVTGVFLDQPEVSAKHLQLATQDGARGLIVLSSSNIITQRNRPLVADAALKRRLPAIGLTPLFARDGLPIAYGPVQKDMYRSAATLVAKTLDSAPPAGLPIERPVLYVLVINLKSAKALGLTIPQSMLARADEVIQ